MLCISTESQGSGGQPPPAACFLGRPPVRPIGLRGSNYLGCRALTLNQQLTYRPLCSYRTPPTPVPHRTLTCAGQETTGLCSHTEPPHPSALFIVVPAGSTLVQTPASLPEGFPSSTPHYVPPFRFFLQSLNIFFKYLHLYYFKRNFLPPC